MAEPTMKDVLDAIAAMRGDLVKTDAKVDRIESRTATVEAKVDAHRLETAKGFADLDVELAKHSDPVHRKVETAIAELRKDVDALKKRPVRPAARPARRR